MQCDRMPVPRGGGDSGRSSASRVQCRAAPEPLEIDDPAALPSPLADAPPFSRSARSSLAAIADQGRSPSSAKGSLELLAGSPKICAAASGVRARSSPIPSGTQSGQLPVAAAASLLLSARSEKTCHFPVADAGGGGVGAWRDRIPVYHLKWCRGYSIPCRHLELPQTRRPSSTPTISPSPSPTLSSAFNIVGVPVKPASRSPIVLALLVVSSLPDGEVGMPR
ncbi:hypothetical protein ZWY2020_000691 [Hordeum vulgare]|nr:hypothetical protein ZWY2020_000691 [Hordeum vulgare]